MNGWMDGWMDGWMTEWMNELYLSVKVFSWYYLIVDTKRTFQIQNEKIEIGMQLMLIVCFKIYNFDCCFFKNIHKFIIFVTR